MGNYAYFFYRKTIVTAVFRGNIKTMLNDTEIIN